MNSFRLVVDEAQARQNGESGSWPGSRFSWTRGRGGRRGGGRGGTFTRPWWTERRASSTVRRSPHPSPPPPPPPTPPPHVQVTVRVRKASTQAGLRSTRGKWEVSSWTRRTIPIQWELGEKMGKKILSKNSKKISLFPPHHPRHLHLPRRPLSLPQPPWGWVPFWKIGAVLCLKYRSGINLQIMSFFVSFFLVWKIVLDCLSIGNPISAFYQTILRIPWSVRRTFMWNREHFSDIDSLSFFAGLGDGRVIASIGSISLKLLLWLNRYLL